MAHVLSHDERILDLAETLRPAQTVLYIGRGTGYPIAMEGALKLKELSYIHAEASPPASSSTAPSRSSTGACR